MALTNCTSVFCLYISNVSIIFLCTGNFVWWETWQRWLINCMNLVVEKNCQQNGLVSHVEQQLPLDKLKLNMQSTCFFLRISFFSPNEWSCNLNVTSLFTSIYCHLFLLSSSFLAYSPQGLWEWSYCLHKLILFVLFAPHLSGFP